MSGITIKLTRRVLDGHLMYDLEGNLKPIPCGSMVETKVSEMSSRRTAMENASDNADELIEKLELQYNRARQASITQEITEIISGSDAK